MEDYITTYGTLASKYLVEVEFRRDTGHARRPESLEYLHFLTNSRDRNAGVLEVGNREHTVTSAMVDEVRHMFRTQLEGAVGLHCETTVVL